MYSDKAEQVMILVVNAGWQPAARSLCCTTQCKIALFVTFRGSEQLLLDSLPCPKLYKATWHSTFQINPDVLSCCCWSLLQCLSWLRQHSHCKWLVHSNVASHEPHIFTWSQKPDLLSLGLHGRHTLTWSWACTEHIHSCEHNTCLVVIWCL